MEDAEKVTLELCKDLFLESASGQPYGGLEQKHDEMRAKHMVSPVVSWLNKHYNMCSDLQTFPNKETNT